MDGLKYQQLVKRMAAQLCCSLQHVSSGHADYEQDAAVGGALHARFLHHLIAVNADTLRSLPDAPCMPAAKPPEPLADAVFPPRAPYMISPAVRYEPHFHLLHGSSQRLEALTLHEPRSPALILALVGRVRGSLRALELERRALSDSDMPAFRLVEGVVEMLTEPEIGTDATATGAGAAAADEGDAKRPVHFGEYALAVCVCGDLLLTRSRRACPRRVSS